MTTLSGGQGSAGPAAAMPRLDDLSRADVPFRAGDFLAGSVASGVGERLALVLGGLACLLGVVTAVLAHREFLAYDERHPTP